MKIVRNVARIILWIFAIATFISMLCGHFLLCSYW